ncbi:MAG: hypothetical protein K2H98_09215 [Duncaniella sp.]|nr:hypothetical protein [Duncaniella sp.]
MVEKYLLYSRIFFVTLWVMLTFPFVSQEIITPLQSLHVTVYLIADFIFLVMGLLTLRNRRDIIVFISFLIIGLTSSLVLNRETMIITFNGTRSYFGLIFSVPIMRWFMTGKNASRFMRSFDRQLFFFLVLQVPCIFWQFFRYGAGDFVGGSLGYWSSGIISSLIYSVSLYLVSKRWDYDDYLGSLRENYIYFLLLIPTFFNETKASFIYLMLYFLLLLRLKISMVKQLVWIVPSALILISGLGVIYLKVTNQEADRVLSYEFFKEYLFGESTEHVVELALAVEDDGLVVESTWGGIIDVPRFTKFIVVPSIFRDGHKNIWWGAGLGQFKGTNVIGITPFSKRFYWLLRGSKPWGFYVFVELGIIGLIWVSFTLISMFLQRNSTTNGLNIKLYIGFMILFFFLYNDSLSSLYFCCLLFYMVMRTHYVPDDEPHLIEEDSDGIDSEVTSPTSV